MRLQNVGGSTFSFLLECVHSATDSVGRIPRVDPLCLSRQVIVNYLLGQFRSQTNSEAELYHKEWTKSDECCVLSAFLHFFISEWQASNFAACKWLRGESQLIGSSSSFRNSRPLGRIRRFFLKLGFKFEGREL